MNMNRRGFLGSLIGGVAATAAVHTWPFRVYSFPTDIVVAPAGVDFTTLLGMAMGIKPNRQLWNGAIAQPWECDARKWRIEKAVRALEKARID